MEFQQLEQVRLWLLRFSLLTAAAIALLSWHSGVRPGAIVLRTAAAFAIMYSLTIGSLKLFEKWAAQDDDAGNGDSRGVLLDVALGDESPGTALTPADLNGEKTLGVNQNAQSNVVHPGQVDPGLAGGLPDHEQQAEIVRRMGWG